MKYDAIPKLEDNERDFVVDEAIIINRAKTLNQTIPNRELIKATKELIKKHNVDFLQLMYVLERDIYRKMWYDNDFKIIFSAETLKDLEKVLFETRRKLLKK